MHMFELSGDSLRKIKSLLMSVDMEQFKLCTSRPVTIIATDVSNTARLHIELGEDLFYSLPSPDSEILLPCDAFELVEVLNSERMKLKIYPGQQKIKLTGCGKYTNDYHNKSIPVRFKNKDPIAKTTHPQKNLRHLLSIARATELTATITFDGTDNSVTWFIGKNEIASDIHLIEGKMHFPNTTFINSPSMTVSEQYETGLLYPIFQNIPECQDIDLSLYENGEIQLGYLFLNGLGSVKYRVRSL